LIEFHIRLNSSSTSDGGLDLIYAQEKADTKKKATGRLVVTPARASH